MRAATYVRLSATRLGEEAPGLDRQREATERLIRERGWELAGRFHDADTSAYTGAPRPGFDGLRRAVEAGEVDAVVVWKLDRAFRSITEAAAFLGLVRERGATFISSSEGIDTSTPFGPVLFSIVAAMAELESRTRSDRVVGWHAQRARRGLPGGGGSRPFGFKQDRVAHEPREARAVREAVRKLLAGETTLTGIARDWNARGLVTPAGNPWRKTTVRRLLLSARVAGRRSHNGGETYAAAWRPIISEEQSADLHRRFASSDAEPPGRRYLLTRGLAVCGVCGSNLVARPRADGARSYICPPRAEGGCGKIRVLAAPLEEHVAGQASLAWDRRLREGKPEPPPENDREADLRRELAADEAALEELARDRYVRRSVTDVEFRAAREDLVTRIGEKQERLARLAEGRGRRTFLADPADLPPAPWEVPPGTDPEGLEDWRAYISEVVERVKVGPAVRGRNRFDPERVQLALRLESPGRRHAVPGAGPVLDGRPDRVSRP